jgi:glycosyltransferase involved in cell wall biosynthesis
MKILLWHGYLLTGSGSNVYTANLARSWRAAGHEVLLMCQERLAHTHGFVDRAGDFGPDNRSFVVTETRAPRSAGSCMVLRPHIGSVLPVFVLDDYEGFDAKLFIDLTDEELDTYAERNVQALRTAIGSFEPDAVTVGHEVMGPAIARRACETSRTPYVAKLHGSGLEYAVKLQERYRAHAEEGLAGASVVVGGSDYMLAAARSVIGDWEPRSVVVNPGCDVDLFTPAPAPEEPEHPTVAFVGKLIPSKGVHLLLASLGLTRRAGLRAVIVGYGGSEEPLHRLAAALQQGDLDAALDASGSLDIGSPGHLAKLFTAPPPGYLERAASVPVEFTGRLEHDALSELLPTFDVVVVPSVLPEAFGMVAAEAAASGTLPIVPGHSGIGEAGSAIEEAIGAPGFLTYDPMDPVAGLAAAIDRVLGAPHSRRVEMGRRAADLARRRWSWEEVASRLLAVTVSDVSWLDGK